MQWWSLFLSPWIGTGIALSNRMWQKWCYITSEARPYVRDPELLLPQSWYIPFLNQSSCFVTPKPHGEVTWKRTMALWLTVPARLAASSYVNEPSWTSFNCLSEGTAVISQTQPFSLLPPATFSDIRRVPNCGILLAHSLRVPLKSPHQTWVREEASQSGLAFRQKHVRAWGAGVNGHSQHSSASTWATSY